MLLTTLTAALLAQVTHTGSARGATPVYRCELGAWEPAFDHDLTGFPNPPATSFNAVHMALIPVGPKRGQVLVWDEPDGPSSPGSWMQRWSIVDPAPTPAFENHELAMPNGLGDLFCSGHCWLPDGTLFVAGGTTRYARANQSYLAGHLAYRFDPSVTGNGAWTRLRDMATDRWYPSCILLAGGDVLVAGGTSDSSLPARNDCEIYDPTLGTWRLAASGSPLFDGPPQSQLEGYPRLFQLASGPIFLAGMSPLTARATWSNGVLAWTPMTASPTGERLFGSAVLFAGEPGCVDDRVLTTGGERPYSHSPVVHDEVELCAASASSAPAWDWVSLPRLSTPRWNHNSVILPDGEVLVVGGCARNELDPVQIFPKHAELFDGTAWRSCASAASPRDYHSTAMLLPDGRVLTAGGESRTRDYQVFQPPYLTCGGARPVITQAPTAVQTFDVAGASYTVDFAPLPQGVSLARLVLARAGSITHHSDFDARHVVLKATSIASTSATFEGPASHAQTPAGGYLLFLVTNEGVPSAASWVRVL